MKLNNPASTCLQPKRFQQDLEILLKQPNYKQLRPCHDCTKPCACSGSTTCTCKCDPNCPHICTVMSSEPARYPIEEKIAKLVFEFNSLRILPTYWSCEGHSYSNGKLFRAPQVWFYSSSVTFPKLIHDYVVNLHANKSTAFPWHVCLAHTDENSAGGFSLEPSLLCSENPSLALLQKDVSIIAQNMSRNLHRLATKYLHQLS